MAHMVKGREGKDQNIRQKEKLHVVLCNWEILDSVELGLYR